MIGGGCIDAYDLVYLPAQGGWELREESDSQILRQVQVTDWHRVERARDMFSLKALSLQDNGWVEV
jgi:hypothetical protein